VKEADVAERAELYLLVGTKNQRVNKESLLYIPFFLDNLKEAVESIKD